MSPLEQRYRSLLRRLPASYRRQWEDDMVATYLATRVPDDPEDAEYVEQCGRPNRQERASITRLALRLRLGGVGDPPDAKAWGDAVRRVALMGLLINSIGALADVWRSAWLSGYLPSPLVANTTGHPPSSLSPGWAAGMLEVGDLLWIASFLAALSGRRRGAVVAGLLAFLPTLVALGMTVRFAVGAGIFAFVTTQVALAIVTVLPLAALAAFHPHAPHLPRRPWLQGLGAGAALAAVPAYLSLVPTAVVVDRPGLLALATIVAGLVVLTGRRSRTDLTWTLTLAIVAGVVLTLRAITLLDLVLVDMTDGGFLVASATMQVLAVAAVGLALWVRTARLLRRLSSAAPRTPPPPTNVVA